MEGHSPVENTCEWKFIKSFILKERQTRYLEMLSKGNHGKFLDEMCGKIWRYLDPCTSVHCRSSVTLVEIAEACPELSKVSTCYVTDYDTNSIGRVCKTSKFYINPKALRASNAMIITSYRANWLCILEDMLRCAFASRTSMVFGDSSQFKNMVDRSGTPMGTETRLHTSLKPSQPSSFSLR